MASQSNKIGKACKRNKKKPPVFIPIIIVSDYTIDTPISLTYHCAAFSISLQETYNIISRLPVIPLTDPDHRPGPETFGANRPSRETHPHLWPPAATIVDYLTTFYKYDDTDSQAMWFHLIDLWRRAALREADAAPPVHISEASRLGRDVRKVLKMMRNLMGPQTVPGFEDRIYVDRPWEEAVGLPRMSGILPWRQWLGEGSPGMRQIRDNMLRELDVLRGVDRPWAFYDIDERWRHVQKISTDGSQRDEDGDVIMSDGKGGLSESSSSPNSAFFDEENSPFTTTPLQQLDQGQKQPQQFKQKNNKEEVNKGKEKQEDKEIPEYTTIGVRYIPQGAIAVMKSQTERLRSLLETDLTSKNSSLAQRAAALADFDKHSLVFPEIDVRNTTEYADAHPNEPSPKMPKHYAASLSGQIRYQLLAGGGMVDRYPGYADPGLSEEDPVLPMVNDSIAGVYQRHQPYEAATEPGPAGEEPFDIWGVEVRAREPDDKMWGTLFDNWYLGEEKMIGLGFT